MKRIVIYIWVTVLLGGMVFFGLRSFGEAKQYESATLAQVKMMSAKALATLQARSLMETLSFGLYKNKMRKKLEKIERSRQLHRSKSMRWLYYSMGFLVLFLCSFWLLSAREFTFFGALSAGIMLWLGLFSPILTVTIHKEIEYLGDVVLSFESKGILGSVEKLYAHGDMVIAGVILLFSVLIPLIKILSMMVVSLVMESRFAHGIVHFFKWIGKWSMLDVFVVATFLVYLSTNKGDVSRAEVGVGLYFFLAYVLVSMLVSLSAEKMLKRVEE